MTQDSIPGLPSSGALVSARSATAEKGRLLFDEYVAGIADALAQEFRLAREPEAVK